MRRQSILCIAETEWIWTVNGLCCVVEWAEFGINMKASGKLPPYIYKHHIYACMCNLFKYVNCAHLRFLFARRESVWCECESAHVCHVMSSVCVSTCISLTQQDKHDFICLFNFFLEHSFKHTYLNLNMVEIVEENNLPRNSACVFVCGNLCVCIRTGVFVCLRASKISLWMCILYNNNTEKRSLVNFSLSAWKLSYSNISLSQAIVDWDGKLC